MGYFKVGILLGFKDHEYRDDEHGVEDLRIEV